jgi:ribosomal-protein-serine acetyltransferase
MVFMNNLVADGLCIRPIAHNEAPALALAVAESHETVGMWLPWCDKEYSVSEAEKWIQICANDLATGTAYNMGIFEHNGVELLGSISINQFNRENNFANLGFWIRQSRQKQQIAPRAVRLMAGFGFDKLGLTRIEIVASAQNHASRRVAEKAGAKFEGILQNRLRLRGAPSAAAMYSLTPV